MFNTIEEALHDLRQGKLILVCDNEDRENEGDLVGIAEFITPESINFMITHGKGLVCVPMTKEYASKFNLHPMVQENKDTHQTAFTQSIDHKSSTTGISAHERAFSIKELINPNAKTDDFRAPGHIFPLIAKDGGVLVRAGHTEATIDLAKLIGAKPVGVICEVINPDGTMSRVKELHEMAKQYNLKLIHIKDLIEYRKKNDTLIEKISQAKLPTTHGKFDMHGFKSLVDGQEIIALTSKLDNGKTPLVRIHSECLTGDGFASLRCDCGEQLSTSMQMISEHGGMLIYLRQEGRGIGLLNKVRAYALQDQGMDTVEANLHLGFPDDLREYYLASQVLTNFGINEINLLSNNPRKLSSIEKYGIKIAKRTELIIKANESNKDYLQVKVDKLGHML